jgi:UTP--glucose-1-phosphate uridylyltransferase
MLPIVDKPLLHHIVLELVEAGIEEIILVTSDSKPTIENYFKPNFKLEEKLKASGKEKELKMIQEISKIANFKFVRQVSQCGTGDAFLTAKDLVGNKPFIGCWGDELLISQPSKIKQILAAYEKFGGNVVTCLRSDDPEWGNKYGFAKGEEIESGIIKTTEIIEKPGPDNRPSNLAIFSGFVFRPEIFSAWENFPVEQGKELHYIDGLNALRDQGIDTYALEIKNGQYYDCGTISSYLKSNLALTLQDPTYGPSIKSFIQEL